MLPGLGGSHTAAWFLRSPIFGWVTVFFDERVVAIARIQRNPAPPPFADVLNLHDALTTDDSGTSNDNDSDDGTTSDEDAASIVDKLTSVARPPVQQLSPEQEARAQEAANAFDQILTDANNEAGATPVVAAPTAPQADVATLSVRTVQLHHHGCVHCPYLVPSSTAKTVTGVFYSKKRDAYVERTVPVDQLPCEPVVNKRCPARVLTLNVYTAADRQAAQLIREANELLEQATTPADKQALLLSAMKLGQSWPERLRVDTIATMMDLLAK